MFRVKIGWSKDWSLIHNKTECINIFIITFTWKKAEISNLINELLNMRVELYQKFIYLSYKLSVESI